MERAKYILIILFSLNLVYSPGQNNPTIYQAYITGNMTLWKNTMDSIDAVPLKPYKDQLDLVNYQYGYIAWCIDNKDIRSAKKYIKHSEELISQLEQKKYNPSLLNAYKAAIIGFKIGISPYKAPFIGPESLKLAEQAVYVDSTNALGYIQLGNIAFYTPSIFGGSKEEAIRHYLHALNLMENQNNKRRNWNYLNLLATIINAHVALENHRKAKVFCIKTLSEEPNFHWVKNTLYPQVLKQLAQ